MSYEEKVEKIKQVCEDMNCECRLFNNPSYPSALIGYVVQNDLVKAVYSEQLIIKELQLQNNWNYAEAYEWYEYNVLNSLPNSNTVNSYPIIVDTFV